MEMAAVPAWVQWAGIGLSAAAAVVGAASAINQGKAAANAAKYNAALAERNAVIARQQAQADAEAQQRLARKKIGAATAAYGASGVAFEGTPLDVLEESARAAELDRQNILYKGELRAMGYADEADLSRSNAAAATAGGYASATGILLEGGAKVARGVSGIGERRVSVQSGYTSDDYRAIGSGIY